MWRVKHRYMYHHAWRCLLPGRLRATKSDRLSLENTCNTCTRTRLQHTRPAYLHAMNVNVAQPRPAHSTTRLQWQPEQAATQQATSS